MTVDVIQDHDKQADPTAEEAGVPCIVPGSTPSEQQAASEQNKPHDFKKVFGKFGIMRGKNWGSGSKGNWILFAMLAPLLNAVLRLGLA